MAQGNLLSKPASENGSTDSGIAAVLVAAADMAAVDTATMEVHTEEEEVVPMVAAVVVSIMAAIMRNPQPK